MKRRLVFLAFCILVAGLDLPQPFYGRLSARDVPPLVDPLFTGFPPPFAPIQDTDAFQTWPPAPGSPTSILVLTGGGHVRFVNPQTGVTTTELQPLGPTFRDPLSVALFSYGGGPAPDTLFAGPAGPSASPFVGWSLTPTPRLLGETSDDWVRTAGIRIIVTNVDADRVPEVIMSSGPGGPGSVAVQFLGRNEQVGFGPFGADHRGGIFVSAGDLTGDGIAEIVTSSEGPGGQLKIFDVVGGQVRGRAEGFPFGPDFPGGVRTAVGDINGDGVGDLVVAPTAGPPRVFVFNVRNGQPVKIADFLAFDQTMPGGVFVTTGLIEGRPFLGASSGGDFKMFQPGPDRLFHENADIRWGDYPVGSIGTHTPWVQVP